MNNTIILYTGILLLGVFIGAVSQILLKKASLKHYDSLIQEYMNPLVIIAYVMFVATTFFSIIAYKVIPLSMGPILETTSYIYVTFFGVKIFGEKLNSKKILSLILIISGIIIYSLFG